VWQALRYRWLAAEQALQRSAYPEALAHCQQGLAVLETLQETPERRRRELALRTCLSTVLAAMDGYVSPVLEQNLQRAWSLCQQMQMTAELAPVLVVLTRLAMVRADRQATEALLAQDRHLLERLDDAASLVQVHTQLGTAEMYRGAHTRAQEHLTHALRLYDPAVHQSLCLTFSVDPRGLALAMSAWRLWLTGWPAQAADAAEQALGHAEALQHPLTLVAMLLHAAHVRQCRGEFDAAWGLVQRLLALASAQDFALYKAGGMMTQGGLLIQRGELVAGMAQLTTGLAQYQAYGAQLYMPFFLAFLAEAHLRCGQVEAGVRVIDEALRLTATHFDRFWEPELHRLRGELLLAHAGPPPLTPDRGAADIAACFQRALDIARQQGAKALELRAAMSLNRWWQTQGKADAARALLTEMYGWFTEGFDTADLQAARILLAG
jgi:predicted ATPase